MMDVFRKEVIKNIRGCLNSTKDALSLRQLKHDYVTLIGEEIPFKKLGFQKLEDFIKSVPDLDLIIHGNGCFVRAVPDQKSAHITDMVSKQKTKTRNRNPSYKVRFNLPKQQQSFSPQTSKWRPKYSGDSWKKYRGSVRPQEVNHSHFVSYKNQANNCFVPSKVVIPDNSTLNRNHRPQATVPSQPQKAKPVKKTEVQNRLTRVRDNSVPAKTEQNNNNSVDNSTVVLQRQQSGSETSTTSTTSTLPDTFNPLNSTKMRLTRMISELSLDRDSGNSSPTEILPPSPSPCATPEFTRTGDLLIDLKSFAEAYKIGEVEVSTTVVKLKRSRMNTCKVKVGPYTYTSYPKEFQNLIEAQNYCCETALDELIPLHQRKLSLRVSIDKDVLQRVPAMLQKHTRPVLAKQLKLDYMDRYNEQLPEDWLKIVESSLYVEFFKQVESDQLLYYCRPEDVLQKGQRRSFEKVISGVSVPANTVQFGDDGKLFAEVTYVMAANEVWCHQIMTDESDQFFEMIGRLELYYSSREDKLKPSSIVESGYYVAKLDDTYFRVKVLKVNDDEANCFFIDHGHEVTIPKPDIFELKREYASAQAQAFVCRLAGLEELYDVSCSASSVLQLQNMQVVIEMASEQFASHDGKDLSLPVYMYAFDTGKSINEELVRALTVESASPALQKDNVTEVFVSNVEKNGDVYVQLRTYGFEKFNEIRASVESEVIANPPDHLRTEPVTKQNSEGKLYFGKYKVDGQWYRIQLIDWSPRGDMAQIYFVDQGNCDVIQVANEVLYPLEELSDVLNQYPHQAVRTRMVLDKIPDDLVELTSNHMPVDQPILLKVIDMEPEDGVPRVEFFKRNSDGGLFCINKSINLDMELRNKEKKVAANLKFNSAKCVPSAGTLPVPELKKVGDFFEVLVPVAANPYNFFVQPSEYRFQLNEMMVQLQERYSKCKYGQLTVSDIVPGQIYASLHGDGYWYRTNVLKVIHSGSVSVFYCDFGYYHTITVKELVPLDEEFLQLPYQALKAKLADIKPKQNKWTVQDCEVFRGMVEQRRLYSKLVAIETDVLYESDIVLKLVLIDTSSEEDLYIDKELIRKGIAVKV